MSKKVLERTFAEVTFVAFDTETTGREPTRARAVEIAAVRAQGAALAGSAPLVASGGDIFQTLVRPDTLIPKLSTSMHGITDQDVKDAPPPAEALRRFFSWLVECGENTVLVAHNAGFDIDIISYAAARAGLPVPAILSLDTLTFTRRALPGLPGYSLEALCRGLSLDLGRFHRATDDARITLDLFRYCATKVFGEHRDGIGGVRLIDALDVLGEPQRFKPHFEFAPSLRGHVTVIKEAIAASREVTLELNRGAGVSNKIIARPLAVYPAPEGALSAALIDVPGETEEGVTQIPLERVVTSSLVTGGQGLLFV